MLTNKTVATKISDDTWSEIIAGEGWDGSHTCGIKMTDSKLYCWGLNRYGQLGDGTAGADTDKNTPVKIGSDEDTWLSIATGLYHTCGIKTDKKLYCWGYNFDGQIGDETMGKGTDKNIPTKTGDEAWLVITAGWNHTCGIKADGKLYCWGYNESGQLGDGTYNTLPIAAKIGDDVWSAITAGDKHTCGIKADKKIYCWGDNGWGALGDGTGQDRLTPTKINDETWSEISAGLFHTCAIKAAENTLYCWGQNLSGQLGDGTQEDKTSPVKIGSETDKWLAVTAGALHTCGIKMSDNKLYCWGDNDFGKLGDGTANIRDENGQIIENKGKNTPTPVSQP